MGNTEITSVTLAEKDAEIAELALQAALLEALVALKEHDKVTLHATQHQITNAYQQALLARMYADERARLAQEGMVF